MQEGLVTAIFYYDYHLFEGHLFLMHKGWNSFYQLSHLATQTIFISTNYLATYLVSRNRCSGMMIGSIELFSDLSLEQHME